MNKTQFLAILRQRLGKLPKQEQEAAMTYYEEYFEEAGTQNEAKVIEQLGDPSRVAAQILAESAASHLTAPTHMGHSAKKQIHSIWYLIGGICVAPVAFPVAIAVAAVIFALLCVVGSVVVAMGAVVFALGCSAVAMFFVGLGLLFSSFATGITFVGMGLMCAGVFILLALPVAKIGAWMIRGIGQIASSLYRKMKGGNGNYEK